MVSIACRIFGSAVICLQFRRATILSYASLYQHGFQLYAARRRTIPTSDHSSSDRWALCELENFAFENSPDYDAVSYARTADGVNDLQRQDYEHLIAIREHAEESLLA